MTRRQMSWLGWSVLVILAGCFGGKSPPTRFYALTSLPGSGVTTAAAAPRFNGTIAVGPVRLPEYLDRPEIVSRRSENRFELADFDHWAEPLADNFAHVLVENLSRLLENDRVVIFPWASTAIAYQVAIEVSRFERQPGGEMLLVARWSISRDGEPEILLRRESRIQAPAAAPGLEAAVAAQSRAVGDLSREIAGALGTLESRTAAR